MIAAGGVDRHRHRHLAEIDASEEREHVIERVDRHALAAHLAEAAFVVGVVAHQRRHVKGGGKPGLAVVEQVQEALVGLLARAEAGELAHRPQPAAIHRLVYAARERVGAGPPDRILGAFYPCGKVGGRVQLAHRLSRQGAEARLGRLRGGLRGDRHDPHHATETASLGGSDAP
jgi:hypothetical protein